MQKYRNKIIKINNLTFRSKIEYIFFCICEKMKEKKQIIEFDFQYPFTFELNQNKIFSYFADFVLYFPNGKRVIIDTKGYKTEIYKLKKKIIEEYFCIQILELHLKKQKGFYVFVDSKKRIMLIADKSFNVIKNNL